MAPSTKGGASNKPHAEQLEGHTIVQNQILSCAASFSLKCAVELGLADAIHKLGRPATLSELASAASIPPEREPMLGRLMRLLVHSRVFAAVDGGATYALTPSSDLLLRDGGNMSALVLALLDEVLVKPWYHLSKLMQSPPDVLPFQLAHGCNNVWDMSVDKPELNALFNDGMASDARVVMSMAVQQWPEVFRGLRSLVDVGGGNGTAANIVAEAFPETKCIVYDLPHVAAAVSPDGRVDAIGGDMFDHVPQAHAVMLKSVLHDWSHENCVKILKNCKAAIPSKEGGGKVILVELVLNSVENNNNKNKIQERQTHLFFDVWMMVGPGGVERDEHDWKKIFDEAGFNEYKIHPLSSIFSIVELYP